MRRRVDWVITLAPFTTVLALCVLFAVRPVAANEILLKVRHILGNTFGVWYLAVGLFFFLASLYIAFSRYGEIVLGDAEEGPRYSFPAWGAMMFTCGLAADILFYSFSEWISYACDLHIGEMGKVQDWPGSTLCFTGGSSPGASTWCWPFHSDSCCTLESAGDIGIPRHAGADRCKGGWHLRSDD